MILTGKLYSGVKKTLKEILSHSLNIRDLNIHPEDKHLFEKLITPESGSPESGSDDTEIRFFPFKKGKYNNVIWTRCQANRIEYDGQNAVLLNIMDISRSKELEQLAITREKMVSLGHMAAGIAHEIRNPLSSINLFFDAYKNHVENPEDDEDLMELFSYAEISANKMDSLIKRVLDFSKSDNIRLEKKRY